MKLHCKDILGVYIQQATCRLLRSIKLLPIINNISIVVVHPAIPLGPARFPYLCLLTRLKKIYPAVFGRLHERTAKRNEGERRRLQQRIRRGQRRHRLAVRNVSCSFFSCAHNRLRVLAHWSLPPRLFCPHRPVHLLVIFEAHCMPEASSILGRCEFSDVGGYSV